MCVVDGLSIYSINGVRGCVWLMACLYIVSMEYVGVWLMACLYIVSMEYVGVCG